MDSDSGVLGSVTDIFSKAVGAGASAFQSSTENDLQSAIAKNNATAAQANATAAQANSSSILKIVLYIGGGIVALGTIFGLVAMFRRGR